LADLRGKAVVLSFWNLQEPTTADWAAMMRSLQARYAGKDVAFVQIHPAIFGIDELRQLQRKHQLEGLVALDAGTGVKGAVTQQKYQPGSAGSGFNILVDREGKIFFNPELVEEDHWNKYTIRACKALSIPWPIDEKASEKQQMRWGMQLYEFYLGEQIDIVLQKK
jgi:hypothetical protein